MMTNLENRFPAILQRLDDVLTVQNYDGISFSNFVKESRQVMLDIRKHVEQPFPEAATAVNQDKNKCIGWLGLVNNRLADAKSFQSRAEALVKEKLRKDHGMSATAAEAEEPIYTWLFKEERERWEALSRALSERVWSARAMEEVWNREHPVQE